MVRIPSLLLQQRLSAVYVNGSADTHFAWAFSRKFSRRAFAPVILFTSSYTISGRLKRFSCPFPGFAARFALSWDSCLFDVLYLACLHLRTLQTAARAPIGRFCYCLQIAIFYYTCVSSWSDTSPRFLKAQPLPGCVQSREETGQEGSVSHLCRLGPSEGQVLQLLMKPTCLEGVYTPTPVFRVFSSEWAVAFLTHFTGALSLLG